MTIVEMKKKYGFNVGAEVVFHSWKYNAGEEAKDYADTPLNIYKTDDETEGNVIVVVKATGEAVSLPARNLERLIKPQIGDTIIVHKPLKCDRYPMWNNSMDKYDGAELHVRGYTNRGYILTKECEWKFYPAWVETAYNSKAFETDVTLDEFL